MGLADTGTGQTTAQPYASAAAVVANQDDTPDAPPPAHVPRVIVNCGAVCVRPLDAVPDSMGRNVYFTAFTTARVVALAPSLSSSPPQPSRKAMTCQVGSDASTSASASSAPPSGRMTL